MTLTTMVKSLCMTFGSRINNQALDKSKGLKQAFAFLVIEAF